MKRYNPGLDMIMNDVDKLQDSSREEELPADQLPEDIEAARQQAEAIYEADLAAAKEEYSTLSIARAEAEIKFKQAKSDEKGALKILQALFRHGPAYPTEQNKSDMGASLSDTFKWIGGVVGTDGKLYQAKRSTYPSRGK